MSIRRVRRWSSSGANIPDDVSVIDHASRTARRRWRARYASWLARHHLTRFTLRVTRDRARRVRDAVANHGKTLCGACGARLTQQQVERHLDNCPKLRENREKSRRADRASRSRQRDASPGSPAKTPPQRQAPAAPAAATKSTPRPTTKAAPAAATKSTPRPTTKAAPAAATKPTTTGGFSMADTDRRPLAYFKAIHKSATADIADCYPDSGRDALQAMTDLARAIRPLIDIADELYLHMTTPAKRGGLQIDTRTLKTFASLTGVLSEASLICTRGARECAIAHQDYLDAEESKPTTPLETWGDPAAA